MELKELNRRGTSNSTRSWDLFGKRFPRQEIVFFAQVIIIYIVIFTCIANLTLYPNTSEGKLWTAVLGSGSWLSSSKSFTKGFDE